MVIEVPAYLILLSDIKASLVDPYQIRCAHTLLEKNGDNSNDFVHGVISPCWEHRRTSMVRLLQLRHSFSFRQDPWTFAQVLPER